MKQKLDFQFSVNYITARSQAISFKAIAIPWFKIKKNALQALSVIYAIKMSDPYIYHITLILSKSKRFATHRSVPVESS
jgi:hypothetical membrane protein